MVRDGQRRSSELLAYFIDSVQDGRLTNEFPFQLAFSWEILERNAHQHGKNSLSGQDQHRDAGRQQHESGYIFEYVTDEPERGMMMLHPFSRRALVKIRRAQSGGDQRDGERGPHKR